MRRMFGFMIGIFIGALVGSTVALLLAPESGEGLRAELRSRGAGFFAELRDRLQSLRARRSGAAELD